MLIIDFIINFRKWGFTSPSFFQFFNSSFEIVLIFIRWVESKINASTFKNAIFEKFTKICDVEGFRNSKKMQFFVSRILRKKFGCLKSAFKTQNMISKFGKK